ncbi:MAG: hypothetical protein IPH93_11250 [Saprospiraceae bacterium]|nr:hypothetical protein [Saprospiraceae bacterium]MBK7812169.1 hypothetical protein [Saprospiraceae bacterium]MBK9632615.1 hypothetical protein [Saprospiraceae bacterium]
MKVKLHFFALLIFSFYSCKSDKKESTPAPVSIERPDNEGLNLKNNAAVQYAKLDQEFIDWSKTQKEYPMITDSIWHFYFALSIAEETPKDNIYKGHWLDLKEDFTYTKGIYSNKTDEGRYLYIPQNGTIELRSTIDSSSEWKLKVDPDAMLFIGTQKYGNNSWQIKFVRKSGLPVL